MLQQHFHAKCVRRCSRKQMLCGGTNGATLPISLFWFVPGTTARLTSLQPSTCSTTFVRCILSSSNTNAPSPTAHACLLCGYVACLFTGSWEQILNSWFVLCWAVHSLVIVFLTLVVTNFANAKQFWLFLHIYCNFLLHKVRFLLVEVGHYWFVPFHRKVWPDT